MQIHNTNGLINVTFFNIPHDAIKQLYFYSRSLTFFRVYKKITTNTFFVVVFGKVSTKMCFKYFFVVARTTPCRYKGDEIREKSM